MNTRHCFKSFVFINSCDLPMNAKEGCYYYHPFYRWEKRGAGNLRHLPAITQLVRAEPGWNPIRVTATPWSSLGALKWMGTPVLRSLPLKVCYPLLAAPHTVDSHKLTVKDFLKSLLQTRMLCPSNPVLFPRQSVLWILCLAWPNYPAALFLTAHKLVL